MTRSNFLLFLLLYIFFCLYCYSDALIVEKPGQQGKLWSQHSKCFTIDKQSADSPAKEKVKEESERGSGGSLREI